jgi:hypothetical protein
MVEANVSLREAHRCVKIWRALWRVAAALKYCQRDADPSLGVRNVEPKPRQAVWEHGEVVRLCKGAWRAGYKGLAAVMAVEPLAGRCTLPKTCRSTGRYVQRQEGQDRPSSHRDAKPAFVVGARRLFVRARRRCRVDCSDLPQPIWPRLFEGHARR